MKSVSVSTYVDAPATAVLDQVSNIARLPEWNSAITEVLESPARLIPGAVWKVRLHALGQTWVSTSTLCEFNEAARRALELGSSRKSPLRHNFGCGESKHRDVLAPPRFK